MIARRIARLPAYLAARAVDAGWLAGHADYRRFVVMGWYRTGSNFLLSLLNSDPAVVAYSELFSPRGLFWGNHVYAPRDPDELLERRRASDARGFLADVVFRHYPARVRAVGFKLFYPQLVVRPVAGLAEALAGDEDLRVVHLRRRNPLRILVSDRIARRTGQMAATSAKDAAAALERAGTLRLDPDECIEYFSTLEARADKCDGMFRGDAVLRVTYEDLVADREGELRRVRAHLGLPPRAGTTPLVRQTTRRLDEILENTDELRRAFEGTPWEGLVDA